MPTPTSHCASPACACFIPTDKASSAKAGTASFSSQFLDCYLLHIFGERQRQKEQRRDRGKEGGKELQRKKEGRNKNFTFFTILSTSNTAAYLSSLSLSQLLMTNHLALEMAGIEGGKLKLSVRDRCLDYLIVLKRRKFSISQ